MLCVLIRIASSINNKYYTKEVRKKDLRYMSIYELIPHVFVFITSLYLS